MNSRADEALCLVLPRRLVLGNRLLLGLRFIMLKDPTNAVLIPAFRKSLLFHHFFVAHGNSDGCPAILPCFKL